MSRRRTKPLWMIEPRLEAGQHRDRVLGTLVKYPDLPRERYIPYRSTRTPRDMVPGLYSEPVQMRDVRYWQRRARDPSVLAKLGNVFSAFAKRPHRDTRQRTATAVRMWSVDAPGDKFRELLTHKDYLDEAVELLLSTADREAYFVTDVVTLVNLEESDETFWSADVGSAAAAPAPVPAVAAAPDDDDAAAPVDLAPRAGARVLVRHEKRRSATYEGETIVFLGYRLVRLVRTPGTRARIGRALLGGRHGVAPEHGLEYWPHVVEKPVEGDFEGFMDPRIQDPGVPGPGIRDHDEQPDRGPPEESEVFRKLGFDVEIFG